MHLKRMTMTVSATAMLFAATEAVLGQQPHRPGPGMAGKEGMPMDHGMMGGGMMNMMQGCQRMMGGGMMAQLPPGNEKLQFQMQAEMMQKMGEIMAKYAARIEEGKPAGR